MVDLKFYIRCLLYRHFTSISLAAVNYCHYRDEMLTWDTLCHRLSILVYGSEMSTLFVHKLQ